VFCMLCNCCIDVVEIVLLQCCVSIISVLRSCCHSPTFQGWRHAHTPRPYLRPSRQALCFMPGSPRTCMSPSTAALYTHSKQEIPFEAFQTALQHGMYRGPPQNTVAQRGRAVLQRGCPRSVMQRLLLLLLG
jgi:hypothetical protein